MSDQSTETMKPSDFFFRLGGSAWLLTAGISILAVFVRLVVDQWFLDTDGWRTSWLFGGGGGVIAFMVAGVFAIWESPPWR